MPGLEAGVLPVVGKGEQLLGFFIEVGADQVFQGGQRQHGRGRAAALARQAGELAQIAAPTFVMDGAIRVEAEAERSGNEPRGQPFAGGLAPGIHLDLDGACSAYSGA